MITGISRRLSMVAIFTFVLAAPAWALAEVPVDEQQETWVLSTKKMCCSKESKPAIAELSKIPGIGKVVANHKKRTLTIIFEGDERPSARAIWEAAEKTNLKPFRLATSDGVYKGKPKR